MHIVFRGSHSSKELLDSLKSVLDYLYTNYGIKDFSDLDLHLMLRDNCNQSVDLVDVDTYQTISVFEVFKSPKDMNNEEGVPNLKLVIDNTKDRE